jgi:hypothetical protein
LESVGGLIANYERVKSKVRCKVLARPERPTLHSIGCSVSIPAPSFTHRLVCGNRSAPLLATDEWSTNETRGQQYIVHKSEHRNEVWNQVDWTERVGDGKKSHRFRTPWRRGMFAGEPELHAIALYASCPAFQNHTDYLV